MIPGTTAAPLTDAERLALLREVERSAFRQFETYRDDHVGADLAYLLGAIIGDEGDSFVDWSAEADVGPLREWLLATLPQSHAVWHFILLTHVS